MDLHLIDTSPSAAERAAVDAVLGGPEGGWDGGERSPADGRVAYGGVRAAESMRHLLLPALHALQDAVGWVGPGGLGYVCRRLSVPPAEAYGVADFYALIATEPHPARVAHVCDDVPCRLAGADDVIQGLRSRFAPEASARGDMMWKRSPCLGQCDRGPAAYLTLAAEGRETMAPVTASIVIERLQGGEIQRTPRISTAPQPPPGDVQAATDLDTYRAADGYRALARALDIGPDGVLAELEASGLRGRGGAAFPTAAKWRAVAAADAPAAYVVCNADESEPGTFKDRVLLEGNPFAVVEAMTIAGVTVGAERGYVYVRDEYPEAERALTSAIAAARSAGLLGDEVAGSGRRFDIEIRRGGGAYICGEETALVKTIEGFRGEPRQKPPFPTTAGLFGMPTVVNNVETLAAVPGIIRDRGAAFAATGTSESTGTKLFSLSGHVARPGVYEVPFGTQLGELLELAGGAVGELRAVLIGGAAGAFVGLDRLDVPLSFEATRAVGLSLGSGAIVPMNTTTDFGAVLRRIAEFFRDESCGQCVPCRIGTVRQEETIVRLTRDGGGAGDTELLAEIDQVMRDASICGLGHTAGGAIRSAMALGLVEVAR